jgi:hypothetical protein
MTRASSIAHDSNNDMEDEDEGVDGDAGSMSEETFSDGGADDDDVSDIKDDLLNEGDDHHGIPDVYEHCNNCMRSQIRGGSSSPLGHLSMELVPLDSTDIRGVRSRLRQLTASRTDANSVQIQLCKECAMFLENPPLEWKKKKEPNC